MLRQRTRGCEPPRREEGESLRSVFPIGHYAKRRAAVDPRHFTELCRTTLELGDGLVGQVGAGTSAKMSPACEAGAR